MIPKSRTRRTISADFSVTDQIIELAKKNGWADPQQELEAFRDYYLAHGTLMADWEAAFRTWLRNQKRWNSKREEEEEPIRTGVWAKRL